jgi:RNase P/RNase MRP subunit p30
MNNEFYPLDRYSLFAALRQNRIQEISYGRSIFFALSAQKKLNVRRYFSMYDFGAKRQRVSVYLVGKIIFFITFMPI